MISDDYVGILCQMNCIKGLIAAEGPADPGLTCVRVCIVGDERNDAYMGTPAWMDSVMLLNPPCVMNHPVTCVLA